MQTVKTIHTHTHTHIPIAEYIVRDYEGLATGSTITSTKV